jgi:hypothetical protein
MDQDPKYQVPNVIPMAQPTSKTCWLACYRMLYKFKGRDVGDIDTAMRKAFGDDGYDSIINQTGLLDEHLAKATAALGFYGMPKTSLADIDKFSDYLRKSGPLMCTGTFSFNKVTGLHAVIICGVDLDAKTMTMVDPYYQVSPEEVKKYPITHSVLIDKLRNVQFSNQGWW